MTKWLITLLFTVNSIILIAQNSFPEKVTGTWEGTMKIYQFHKLVDSLPIKLLIKPMASDQKYQWQTQYLSTKHPMTKDYVMQSQNTSTNSYLLDEGDGNSLIFFEYDNKLWSSFKVNDVYLNSTYELKENKLIFEVTSAKLENKVKDVSNFNIQHYQKAILTRQKL